MSWLDDLALFRQRMGDFMRGAAEGSGDAYLSEIDRRFGGCVR